MHTHTQINQAGRRSLYVEWTDRCMVENINLIWMYRKYRTRMFEETTKQITNLLEFLIVFDWLARQQGDNISKGSGTHIYIYTGTYLHAVLVSCMHADMYA